MNVPVPAVALMTNWVAPLRPLAPPLLLVKVPCAAEVELLNCVRPLNPPLAAAPLLVKVPVPALAKP